MIEHFNKQKNSPFCSSKKQIATLKIKNITFSRQFTKTIDQELMNFHLRMGRNTTQKYFDCKSKNKQNSSQVNVSKDKRNRITDMFSIKSVNLTNSSKLFIPAKLFRDSTSIRLNQFNQITTSQSSYFIKRKSQAKQTKQGRINQKSKTALQQHKRLSSSQTLNRKSRAQTQKFNQRLINRQKKLSLNTSDRIFQNKFLNYCNFLKSVAQYHQLNIQFQDYQKPYTFIVGKGNNSKLVKETLKKRWWLKIQQKKQAQPVNYNEVNFIWSQVKINDFYLNNLNLEKSIHNHFQCNGNLGNKKQLFMNMKKYFDSQGKDPFQILPLTFHIKNTNDKVYQQFKLYFQNQKQKGNSKNIWIVKPGQNSNRGRGITIHTEISQIQKLMEQQNSQMNESQRFQNHTFIVQKYIQRPFLYQKRKFDIRCYYLLVNLNDSIKAYWYKDGYIRTSCFQFNCNQQNNSNFYMHLTNDAVQKHSQNYGKFQDGNKIDYSTFKKYISSKNLTKKYNFDIQVYQKMKSIALDSIKSTYNILKTAKRQTFEIFGLDFMIDEDFKPWLIQINTNPCLQTTCLVLERIIPKMLDDAFQLSIDVLFPPPKTWPSSRRHLIPNHQHSGFEMIFDEKCQQN